MTAEREARALAALEKGSAERAAALASRERLLQEREDKVVAREVELEGLKSHLTRLLSGLDAHREAEQQVLAGQAARLSKETARLEALQVCLWVCWCGCTSRVSLRHQAHAHIIVAGSSACGPWRQPDLGLQQQPS